MGWLRTRFHDNASLKVVHAATVLGLLWEAGRETGADC